MTDSSVDRDRLTEALPGYEIGGEVGRGAFGVVRSGRHRQLGRDVAIKQLPPVFAADPAVRRRFASEARVLASLDHPHIVPIFDYVEREGLCALVMEYLPGGSVRLRQQEGMTPQQACAIALATCAALDFAHERGVLHRDIKPDNLLFTANRMLKVTDFGIAKVVGATMATRVGEALGTPAYMAPEQCLGRPPGPSTDVYATAVMLYELLAGHLPFSDDGDVLALLYRHVHEAPPPLAAAAPDLPEGLGFTVMRAMAKDPADRYPSAEAFGVALAETATAAWGVGWLKSAGLKVMAVGPIHSATERPSLPPRPAAETIRGPVYATPAPAPAPVAVQAGLETPVGAPPGGPPVEPRGAPPVRDDSNPPRRTTLRTRRNVLAALVAVVVLGGATAGIVIGLGSKGASGKATTTTIAASSGGAAASPNLLTAAPFSACTDFSAAARDASSVTDEIYCDGTDVAATGAVRVWYLKFGSGAAATAYVSGLLDANDLSGNQGSCQSTTTSGLGAYCTSTYSEHGHQGQLILFQGTDFAFGGAGDTAQTVCSGQNLGGQGTSVLAWSSPAGGWDGLAFSCVETGAAELLANLNQGNYNLVS